MTEPMTLDEMRAASVYILSDMASCETPDSSTSAGGKFLDCVRDAVIDKIESGSIKLDDFNDDGQLSEISDDAPSVYTHTRWAQFVDVSAYLEDPEITDEWPTNLTEAAGLALYQIADRLAYALCEAWREGWECPTCGEGADDASGCTTEECGNPAGALVALVVEHLDNQAGNGPESVAEPLPVRTPGVALAEAQGSPDAVLTRPVDLSLIDRAEATDMGIRVTRAAMAHETRVRRFRRWVWTSAGVLAVTLSAMAVILAR